MVKVRWCQANGNWYLVCDETGEIHGSAKRADDGLWLAEVFPNLRNTYWSADYAKRGAELALPLPPMEYEIVSD